MTDAQAAVVLTAVEVLSTAVAYLGGPPNAETAAALREDAIRLIARCREVLRAAENDR